MSEVTSRKIALTPNPDHYGGQRDSGSRNSFLQRIRPRRKSTHGGNDVPDGNRPSKGPATTAAVTAASNAGTVPAEERATRQRNNNSAFRHRKPAKIAMAVTSSSIAITKGQITATADRFASPDLIAGMGDKALATVAHPRQDRTGGRCRSASFRHVQGSAIQNPDWSKSLPPAIQL